MMTYMHTYIHNVVHQFRVCITAVFVILHTHQLVNVKNTGHQKLMCINNEIQPVGTLEAAVCVAIINNITNDENALPICTAMKAMPASMKKPPVGGALSSSMHDAWAINSLNENNFLYNNV